MIPVCPRCDESLFILEFKEIEVDFCHRCRGLWLDAGELELLLEKTGAKADEPLLRFQTPQGKVRGEHRLLCPRCDRRLVQVDARGEGDKTVAIDRCPDEHGLWFDATELQKLLGLFPPSSGASKTVDYLNELLGSPKA